MKVMSHQHHQQQTTTTTMTTKMTTMMKTTTATSSKKRAADAAVSTTTPHFHDSSSTASSPHPDSSPSPQTKRQATEEKRRLVQAYSKYLDDIAQSAMATADATAKARAAAAANAANITSPQNFWLLANTRFLQQQQQRQQQQLQPLLQHPLLQHPLLQLECPIVRFQQASETSNNPVLVLHQLLSMIAPHTTNTTTTTSPTAAEKNTVLAFCKNAFTTLVPTLVALPSCFRLDAVWTILRAMDLGQESLTLQVEACKLLECLLDTTSSTTTIASAKRIITHKDNPAPLLDDPQEARLAVRILLRAICRFPYSVNLQCLGLDLVHLILDQHDSSKGCD
jgi:hypothetical protein